MPKTVAQNRQRESRSLTCQPPAPSGISRQSSFGGPMSTVTSPSPAALQERSPPVVAISMLTGFMLRHQQPGHATRGIAAGFHFTAVRIENTHEGRGAVLAFFHHNDLIASDSAFPVGDRPCHSRGDGHGENSSVKDGKVIAESMHFQERCHGRVIGPHVRAFQRSRSCRNRRT